MWLRLLAGVVALLVIGVAALFAYLKIRFDGQGAKLQAALWALLQPVGQQLLDGEPVDAAEVRRLAQRPATRGMLLSLLQNAGQADLFPAELLTRRAEAETKLASWLMLPNEMQAEPTELELMEIVARPFRDLPVEVYVFKFKLPAGHWDGSDWRMGVAGPFFADEPPFEGRFGACSRGSDRPGAVEPGALVDWYLDLLSRKFPAATAR